MESHPSGAAGQGGTDALAQLLQRFVVVCLAVVTLVCVHEFISHLHSILMPFMLSVFLVFAVEPAVEFIYQLLAGLSPPYRWCGCLCLRRQRQRRGKQTGSPEAVPWPKEDDEAAPRYSGLDARAASEADSDAAASEPLIDRSHEPSSLLEGVCRFVSVSIILGIMMLVICAFVSLLVRGAMNMKENWGAYQTGLQNCLKWMDSFTTDVSGKLHVQQGMNVQFKTLYNALLLRLQDLVSMIVNEIVSTVSAGVSTLIMVSLYMLFWLLRPLPIDGNASALVRNYLTKKTFVSLLYGVWVSLLFMALGNDLAIFFGMVSFFLNFVPEVGAIISILVPIPVIMLDGRLHSPLCTCGLACLGQLLLKLAINNVLELKLVEKDREMSIHPVWVLLNLNYFGYVWGPIGMLISVPMLAMLKSAVLSATESTDEVTAGWADTLLSILDGRPGSSRRIAKSFSARPSFMLAASRATKDKAEASDATLTKGGVARDALAARKTCESGTPAVPSGLV